jgi:hypothetical protein
MLARRPTTRALKLPGQDSCIGERYAMWIPEQAESGRPSVASKGDCQLQRPSWTAPSGGASA